MLTDVIEHRCPARVAVVGAGNVVSTFAYALLLSGLVSEIVLIDANRAKAEGEAMELNHTVPFAFPTRVWAGEFSTALARQSRSSPLERERSRAKPVLIWSRKTPPSGGRSYPRG